MSLIAAVTLSASSATRFIQARTLGHGEKYALAAVGVIAAVAAIKDWRRRADAVSTR
jgi:hypothetical protein